MKAVEELMKGIREDIQTLRGKERGIDIRLKG